MDVQLNTEVGHKLLAEIPVWTRDVGIIATGPSIRVPSWLKETNVKVVTTFEALGNRVEIASPIVVIGADKAALTTACYLAGQNHQVVVVGEWERPAQEVGASWRWRYVAWLKELSITFMGGYQVIGIDPKGISIKNGEGKEDVVPAATIVWGVREPHKELMYDLEYMFDELYIIGDALEPRSIRHAIHEGYRLGVRI